MRTDSFSKEKHLPIRRFIADESKVATGLYGPRAIADDLDNLFNMFDPEATFLDGSEQGGISEKNLQNGAVSYEKLGADVKEKFEGIATEKQLTELCEELDEKLDSRAEKSTTLSGYGITDAYTKGEIDNRYLSKGDFIEEQAKFATSEMLNRAVGDMQTSVSKKMEEVILYEEVVTTSEWENQPTYEGTLDSAFTTDDFYYITLKDADGNTLPENQFMLKEFYTDGATVYSTVFTLDGRKTGDGTLIENYPVEFTQIGATAKLRDAGVWEVKYNPSEWKLNGNHGSLKFVCDGEFIQRTSSAYFVSQFQTDKNVSHYHSEEATSYQTDSDYKNLGLYVNLNTYSDKKAAVYKANKFYNEMTITRISDTCYQTQRTVSLRCFNFSDNNPRVMSGITFGHGEIQQGDTYLKKINIQVAAVTNRGFIRNGSVIRVSEVK